MRLISGANLLLSVAAIGTGCFGGPDSSGSRAVVASGAEMQMTSGVAECWVAGMGMCPMPATCAETSCTFTFGFPPIYACPANTKKDYLNVASQMYEQAADTNDPGVVEKVNLQSIDCLIQHDC
ncbi:MAG: hypothetical protein WCO86_16775, partial [Planctomycetota bacterium]